MNSDSHSLNLSPSTLKTRGTCQTDCRRSPRHALRRSGWLAFGPRTRCLCIYPVVYPSAFTNRILGAVYTECRDVPIPVFGCGHSQPPLWGAGALLLHNDDVLAHRNKASLFSRAGHRHGKFSTVCFGDSHNELFLCLL